ncbi:MAG: hypothetical protein KDB79_04910 [Acidobacteria bacterium]|nr:hypothetical protein [Acidobacteriota bacterium]
MKKTDPGEERRENEKFVEGQDFYYEDGLMVLTAKFLSKRGYCCDNGCRHCPYPKPDKERSK